MEFRYKNHLAHIYIYAYDNRPEVVAKAYRSEALLVHFSKGVELAKEIGNINLVIGAFKKNTMIASTNGMNEIAMLYVVRLCEYLTEAEHVELAILFLDLDNFKPYNDTFGHDAGDIVLVGMANIFKEVTDKKGFVCRYGGDEFIIVAHTTDKETLEKMVHEIYSRIEAADGFVKELKEKLGRDISIDENKRLTVSIGIALRNESDKSIDDTIKRADDLMYTVKTNGKGTYAFI